MDRHDDPADDAALARRVAAGHDPLAEAELCRRLVPRIRAYGRRHLGDTAAASDLAQHVLVVLLEALRAGSVREPERLSGFVMGTCRRVISHWRKGERRKSALLERFGASFDTVAESAPPALDRERLAQCLETLPARARTIVAMTYFAESDGEEIAHALAMSIGNVRVTRHRALQQLHDCLTGGTP